MIPEVGKKYKPMEGTVVGTVSMIQDNMIVWSANDGRVVHSIPWLRFCEYFELVPEEATAV